MGFSVSSKIKLNMPVVKQLDRAKQQALEQTGDALLKQVKNTQVMPFDTGHLEEDATFVDYSNSKDGKATLVSSTPYARRLYYHPEYRFQKGENPNAKGKWLDDWLPGGGEVDFAPNAFKRFYKKESGV